MQMKRGSGIQIDRRSLIETASALVDIPSPTGDEFAMAEHIARVFHDMGLHVQWQEVEEGRPNVLGTWRGTGGGKTLMFNGHMDTSYSGREPWLAGVRGFQPDPFVKDGQFSEPGKKVELTELYQSSDFISVHPPLTPQTRGMINDDAFSKMKPGAVLINCSRGPVVDTAALVRALDTKKIAGCALDTTDPEPLPDPHPLRGRDNVIINPHVAWYSETAMVGLQAGAPNEVRRVLSGEWPINVVNKAVKGKSRAGL